MARLAKPHIPEATRARWGERQRREADWPKRLARALLFYAGSAREARRALADAVKDYDAVHNPRRRGRPPSGNLAVLLLAAALQQRQGCGKRDALREAMRLVGTRRNGVFVFVEPTAKSIRQLEEKVRGRTLADYAASLLEPGTKNPG